MAGGSESMVIASMWASMAAWCMPTPTPTLLFCVMNLIIATIFIASKSNIVAKHQENVQWNSFTPIARVSSFLERANSLKLSSSTTTTVITVAAESQHQYPSPPKTPTTPTYSSLSRLAQSIHFPSGSEARIALRTAVSSPQGVSDDMSQSERHPPRQPVRAPSVSERVKSINFSSVYSDNTFQTESKHTCNSPGQLVRAPSVLHRIKSFKIPFVFKLGAPTTQPENFDTEPAAHNSDHHVIKSKSEKTSAKKPLAEMMKKSRSEMNYDSDSDEDVDARRPATVRARRKADDADFDLKADDFISRFKQQLKLQRVESLVRFRDMLNRGT